MECLSEILRQKGVQDGIKTRVHVRQYMGRNLNHQSEFTDRVRGNGVGVVSLQQENDLDWTPAASEDENNDDDQASHSLLEWRRRIS